jgi:ribosome maturation factor RimP
MHVLESKIFVLHILLITFASKFVLSLRGPKSPFLMVQNLELMDLNKEVTGLVKQFIDNDEIFLVDVHIKGKPGNLKIQVFIDGDQSVNVDECSKISRKLTNELEEKDMIDGRYLVEVSSPGVDRPLKLIRQFSKHIGRELAILTKNNKKYQGELLDVLNDEIEISIKSSKIKKELDSDSLKLPVTDIEKSTVVLRF